MSAVAAKTPRVLWPLLLLLGTALLLALTVRLAGQAPVPALAALWRGAFGSVDALAATGARALILALHALAIIFSFRAGLLNLGAEGQSRIAAATATALSIGVLGATFGSIPILGIPLVLVVGAASGALWSLLAGVLRFWRGASEVITTLMLNFVAILLVKYLVSDPALLRDKPILQQSELINAGLQLPGWGMTEFHTGALLAIPVVLAAHFFLFHTSSGFALRALGLNPVAAEACGIQPRRLGLWIFAAAGALSGLAGAIGILARGRLDVDPTYPDYGFMAIAVALVADLRPLWVLPAAIIFAGLEVGTRAMERNAGVAHEIVYVIEGAIILAVLIRGVQGLQAKPEAAASSAAEASA